jgi:hypothetical protein
MKTKAVAAAANPTLGNTEATQKEFQSLWEFVLRGVGTQKAIDHALQRIRQIQVEYNREQEPSITCPNCGMKSYNPSDVMHRYCGHCHKFHDDL